MDSKRFFTIGYILLFASFGLSILVFGASPATVFTLPKGVSPDLVIVVIDSTPTVIFFFGVGFLLAGQLKQRSEKVEEL